MWARYTKYIFLNLLFLFPPPLPPSLPLHTLQCIGTSSGNKVVGLSLSGSAHFPGSKRLISSTTVSSFKVKIIFYH